MKKLLFLFLVTIVGISSTKAIDHFTPIWSGNGYDHMNIYIYAATLDNQQLESGDEIGVFDGDNCVGVALVEGEISESNPLEIRVSKDDPTTGDVDGYAEGNNLQFRIWDESRDIEATNIFRSFSFGNGVFNAGASATVSLSGFSPNTAPEFTSSPVTSATEGVLYEYTVEVNDPDINANIVISKSRLPGWLTLIDNGDGTAKLTGVPENKDVGTHQVEIAASDRIINTPIKQSFTITVENVNDEPVFESVPKTKAQESVIYGYIIQVKDVDDSDVTIAATTLPSWLQLLDTNNVQGIGGIPTQANVGEHNVVLTASDGKSTVQQSFTITVIAADNEPQITTTALPAGSQGTPYENSIEFTDTDSESLTVRLLKSPLWLSIEESGSNEATVNLSDQRAIITLVGTPLQPRTYQVVIGYSDGSFNKQAAFDLVVSDVNDKPEARSYKDTLQEDKISFIGLAGFDKETPNNALTFNIISPPNNGTLTKVSSVFFKYQPNKDFTGNDTIQYAVFDDGVPRLSDTGTVVLTVLPTNDRPFVTVANPRITMEENDTIDISLQLNDDSDTTTLGLIKAFGPFNGKFIGDSLTGEYQYIPMKDFVGTDVIFVQAKELHTPEQLVSEPLMLQIRVTNVNAPPIAFPRIVRLLEDHDREFRLFAFDQEDNLFDLTLEIIDQPNKADSITLNGNIATYYPKMNEAGRDSFTYRVVDLNGAISDTAEVKLKIRPINDRPTAKLDTVIWDPDEGNLFDIDFSNYISDVEVSANALSIEFMVKKEGFAGQGLFGGQLSQRTKNVEFDYDASTNTGPDSTDFILYRVSDGMLKSEATALVVMTKNNYSNKSFTVAKDLKAAKDTMPTAYGDSTSVNFGEEVEVLFIGIDNDSTGLFSDTLDVEIIEPPSKGKFTFNKGFKATSQPGVPTTSSSGLYAPSSTSDAVIFDEVKFKVSKPSDTSLSDTNTVRIRIIPANAEPTISDIPNLQGKEDESHSHGITFTDLDDTTSVMWNFSANTDSVGFKWDTVSNTEITLTVTPPKDYYGNMLINVQCSDSFATATDDFVLEIENTNDAPVLKTPDNQATFENQPLSLVLFGEDVDSDSLTYTATSKNPESVESLSVDDNVLTIMPKDGFIGDDSVYVTVSDNEQDALTDRKGFKLTVAPADEAPLLADISDKEVDEDNTLNFTVSPTDTDTSETLTVTVLSTNQGLIPEENITVDVKAAKSDVTRSIQITPEAEAYGEGEISVKVTDNQGNQTVKTFKVSVSEVDDPPSFDQISDITMDEEGTETLILSATDVDSDNLTFSAESNSNNLSVEQNGSEFTLTGAEDFYGNVTLDITVKDANNTINDVVNVTVNNVQDKPAFTSDPVEEAEVGEAYSYTVTFEDPDDEDQFDLSGTTLPGWLKVTGNPNGTFTISGTPANDHKGNNEVVLTLSDGKDDVQQSFTINVTGGVGIESYISAENINVYPNPSNGSFEIKLVNKFVGDVDIRIYDVAGKLAYRKIVRKATDNEVIPVNLESPSEGHYQIQIVADDKVVNKKILIK